MKTNLKRGFTLVELLVVIAIIGILVGLLVPAVNFARETARKTECLNNVRGIGNAMLLHETDKGHFPGRVSFVRATDADNKVYKVPVSWMTKLLPFIEQGSVWDQVVRVSSGAAASDPKRYAIDLEIATCPSDPIKSENNPAPMNYVMNCGIWDRDIQDNRKDLRANGVGLAIYNDADETVDVGYIGKNDGNTQTLLLSENVNAGSWVTLEEGLHGFVWTLQSNWGTVDETSTNPWRPKGGIQYQINEARELFRYEELLAKASSSDARDLVAVARPSSNHSGGVNAIFCDGHGQFISEDINPFVYAQLMTTSRTQARHPQNPLASGKDWTQVQLQMMSKPLEAGDY